MGTFVNRNGNILNTKERLPCFFESGKKIIIIGVQLESESLSLETPMDVSLETPGFSLEIPIFSLETPRFSLETPIFY